MIGMIANESIVKTLKQTAKVFLTAMQRGDYETVWNTLITPEAARLLSIALFPVYVYKQNKIDELLKSIPDIAPSISIDEGMALAFQVDADEMRSNFFRGVANGLKDIGWYEFSNESCLAFVDKSAAVLVADSPRYPLIMPFIEQSDGSYKVDFEAICIFSLAITASSLYQIGTRALELGQRRSAIVYFELAASLLQPHLRLKRLVWDHVVVQQFITDTRKRELQNDNKYALLARHQVQKLLSGPKIAPPPIAMDKFLAATFKGYTDIFKIELNEQEIAQLHRLDDGYLRRAIASILIGVDPVIAQREANKPHGPAEISDMELTVEIDNKLYYLCLPFKSGLEIKQTSVPVDIAYQIIRPFMYFPNCIVVFITAKPCSQHLHNYIKQARATQGWAIEVIQHEELGKLLKINGLLQA